MLGKKKMKSEYRASASHFFVGRAGLLVSFLSISSKCVHFVPLCLCIVSEGRNLDSCFRIQHLLGSAVDTFPPSVFVFFFGLAHSQRDRGLWILRPILWISRAFHPDIIPTVPHLRPRSSWRRWRRTTGLDQATVQLLLQQSLLACAEEEEAREHAELDQLEDELEELQTDWAEGGPCDSSLLGRALLCGKDRRSLVCGEGEGVEEEGEEKEEKEEEKVEAVSAQLLFMMSLYYLLPWCFRRGYWLSPRVWVSWVVPEKFWHWILLAASFLSPVQRFVRLWILVHSFVYGACVEKILLVLVSSSHLLCPGCC